MTEFILAVKEQTFLQYALLTGILASIASGIIGSYVVTKRITYIAGGISHTVLAGLGAAKYCQVVLAWKWFNPLYGAVISAILAALLIGTINLSNTKQREDTIISGVWAIGIAIGILFIFKTPGYNENLTTYLFGNILMVSLNEIWLIAGLDILIVSIGIFFYNKLLAVCFDEEFAKIKGINVSFYYLLLLSLIALTVVLLVTIVGIVMVIALLTLPVAISGLFTKKLWHMMLVATILTIVLNSAGLFISYKYDLPAGATIIVLTGTAYLTAIFATRLIKS